MHPPQPRLHTAARIERAASRTNHVLDGATTGLAENPWGGHGLDGSGAGIAHTGGRRGATCGGCCPAVLEVQGEKVRPCFLFVWLKPTERHSWEKEMGGAIAHRAGHINKQKHFSRDIRRKKEKTGAADQRREMRGLQNRQWRCDRLDVDPWGPEQNGGLPRLSTASARGRPALLIKRFGARHRAGIRCRAIRHIM